MDCNTHTHARTHTITHLNNEFDNRDNGHDESVYQDMGEGWREREREKEIEGLSHGDTILHEVQSHLCYSGCLRDKSFRLDNVFLYRGK